MFFVERSRLWDFPFVSPKLHLFLDRSEEKKKIVITIIWRRRMKRVKNFNFNKIYLFVLIFYVDWKKLIFRFISYIYFSVLLAHQLQLHCPPFFTANMSSTIISCIAQNALSMNHFVYRRIDVIGNWKRYQISGNNNKIIDTLTIYSEWVIQHWIKRLEFFSFNLRNLRRFVRFILWTRKI